MRSVRIAVTADLHFGITDESAINKMLEEIAEESVDALVVAGDIGEPYNNFVHCLKFISVIRGRC